MTTTAQYASVPRGGVAQISAANTNRDGTGALVTVITASPKAAGGMRIDGLAIQAAATTTAGMVRLYVQKGRPGETITSITFVTTTATVTTQAAHGLTTGNTVQLIGALPDDYNVADVAITVTGANTFTYTMGTTPTVNATTLGSYCTSTATPVARLLKEIPVTALVPSGTVQAFAATLTTADRGYFPLVLPPGYSLRASTHNAEVFNLIPTTAGDFS